MRDNSAINATFLRFFVDFGLKLHEQIRQIRAGHSNREAGGLRRHAACRSRSVWDLKLPGDGVTKLNQIATGHPKAADIPRAAWNFEEQFQSTATS
jgi:hypothetical protein